MTPLPLLVFLLLLPADNAAGEALQARALRLAHEVIIADTHIDVPYRLREEPGDISIAGGGGDFDFPRAKAGGLDAVFMSIYTPAEYEIRGWSKALADSLIDMVQGFAVSWPDKFAMAASPAEVREVVSGGKIALLLGMENGSPVDGDLANLRYFFDRGVRYITLTHSKDNHICDSSYDDRRTWKGLSPFGRKVVAEMNRLGIMIDVSHVSDDAFYEVLELSNAPVIASHSSCRAFTPGFERNMSDEMIERLAAAGGVIQINFGSVFIDDTCRRNYYAGREKVEQFARANRLASSDKRVKEFKEQFFEDNPIGFADIAAVVAHVDHVVKLVGVDHVGFGSDFDGVGDSLPIGLKDVSDYPNLIAELLAKGYSDGDIEKLCSGNLFRVWEEVANVARSLAPPGSSYKSGGEK